MAITKERLSELTAKTAAGLTSSCERWKAFLVTSAWMYKYRYDQQLAIHAQRPDARSCLTYDDWKKKAGRAVISGAKGIGLLFGDKMRYIFDVTDTQPLPDTRQLRSWYLRDGELQAVADTLAAEHQSFSGELDDTSEDKILSAVRSAVGAGIDEHLLSLHRSVVESRLEGLDAHIIDNKFVQALNISVGYTVLSRLGIDADRYFNDDEFDVVFDFDTPALIAELSSASADISSTVLEQIEYDLITFRKKVRQKFAKSADTRDNDLRNDERSVSYNETRGQTDKTPVGSGVRASGGRMLLSDTADRSSAGGYGGQIRTDASEVLVGASKGTVLPSEPVLHTESPSAGGGQSSRGTTRSDDTGVGRSSRSHRGPEDERSPEVGRNHEQLQGTGRGDSPPGAGVQLSLFSDSGFGNNIASDPNTAESDKLSAFTLPQDIIDTVLMHGGNTELRLSNVIYEFAKEGPVEERAALLKRVYVGGNGLRIDGKEYTAWYTDEGIRISRGRSARYSNTASVLPWEDAAQRIDTLLNEGRFAVQSELDEAESKVRAKTSALLHYIYRDRSDKAKSKGYFPSLSELPHNFPEGDAKLSEMLADPESRTAITAQYKEFLEAYKADPSLMRFNYQYMDEVAGRLEDLSQPRRAYGSMLHDHSNAEQFITDDEIDSVISHGSSTFGKERIYEYFLKDRSGKGQAGFIKKEYGTGGHSHAISGASGSWEEHSANGIQLKKAFCVDVFISWPKVAERIERLIREDRYLTPDEKDHIEKRALTLNAAPNDELSETADVELTEEAQTSHEPAPTADAVIPAQADNTLSADQEQEGFLLYVLPDIVSLVSSDTEYRSACANDSESDARKACREAVKRAAASYGRENRRFSDMYRTNPGFVRSLRDMVFANTYSAIRLAYTDMDNIAEPQETISLPPDFQDNYNDIKRDHPNDIVLYQVGDFFEMFGPDARVASNLLGLHLTIRSMPGLGRVAMCGVPAHTLEQYVERLRESYGVTIAATRDGSAERNLYSLAALNRTPTRETSAEALSETNAPEVEQTAQTPAPQGEAASEDLTDLQKMAAEIAQRYEKASMRDKLGVIAEAFGTICKHGKIETSPCTGKWRGTSDVYIRFDNGVSLFIGNRETPKAKTLSEQHELVNAALARYNPEIISAAKEAALAALLRREAIDNEIAEQKGLKPYTMLNVEFNDGTDEKVNGHMGWYYVTLAVDGKIVAHLDTGLNHAIANGKVSDTPTRENYYTAGALKEADVDYVFNNVGFSSTANLYTLHMSDVVRERAEKTLAEREAARIAANAPHQGNTFTIYQLKSGDETRALRFEPYDRLQAVGLAIDPANYELIYTAPLTPDMTLESIYERFNIDRPEDFIGHSLSVSDVIVLHQNGQETAHYCDRFGFTAAPEFFQEKQREPLSPAPTTGRGGLTYPEISFRWLQSIAPEIVSGEATYIRFAAGEGLMPLTIERLYDDRIAISHRYEQNGDLMADPDMEFEMDTVSEKLIAKTFQQDSTATYQSVDDINPAVADRLERQLNKFTRQWFKNISNQGYHRERMSVRYKGKSLDVRYDSGGTGGVIQILGWDRDGGEPLAEWNALIREYAHEHSVDYDIGYGRLGNGITVWNRLLERDGDYETIAHISDDGELKLYGEHPEYVVTELEREAQREKERYEEKRAADAEALRKHEAWMAEHFSDGKQEQARDAHLDRAKELINDFCMKEYDSHADFGNISNVNIAYTTVYADDGRELPVQVSIDLDEYSISRHIGDTLIDKTMYDSMESFVSYELEGLDFDELTSFTDEEIERAFEADTVSLVPEPERGDLVERLTNGNDMLGRWVNVDGTMYVVEEYIKLAEEVHLREVVFEAADSAEPELIWLSEKRVRELLETPAFLSDELILPMLAKAYFTQGHDTEDITRFFAEHSEQSERVAFLKEAFGDAYCEVLVGPDKHRCGYKGTDISLMVWDGPYTSNTAESGLSWAVVERIIHHMIEMGRFAPEIDVQVTVTSEPSAQDHSESAKQLSLFGADQRISQSAIDAILSDGSDSIIDNSTLRICAFFKRNRPTVENADFIRKEYGKFGKGYVVDGERFAAWFDEGGVRIAQGDTAIESDSSVFISWEQAALRIRQLLDSGKYMTQADLDRVDRNEQREIAEAIWHLDKDCEGISLIDRPDGFHGYPEESAYLAGQLSDRSQLMAYRDRIADLVDRYERDRDVLRFHYHRPKELLDRMDGLLGERIDFTSDKGSLESISHFVTQDEMDAFIVGDDRHISTTKLKIYAYFLKDRTQKEKVDFLKSTYGTGGGGSSGYQKDYDAKGITITRSSLSDSEDKRLMRWSAVAKRIDQFIASGRYMSSKELAHIPEYEKQELARSVAGFFQNKRDCPKPYGKDAAFMDAADAIRPQLDDMERVREIAGMMRSAFELLAPDDRYYDYDKKALDDLTAFFEGRFSLFGNPPEAVPAEKEATAPDEPSNTAAWDNESKYRLLDRLRSDCEYYLGAGGRDEKHLWAGSVEAQIAKMRELYDQLPDKPEWLTVEDIDSYAERMASDEPVATKKTEPAAFSTERFAVNYRITDDNLGHGGPKAKYTMNINALRLLKEIESEGRGATAAEQEILSRYVGWGGIPEVFDESKENWSKEYAELKELLTPEEYEAARASTLNAHYTSPTVIKAIYAAVGNMGFRTGNILEPSCGVGNFFGMLPESMNGSSLYGVELDSITGRIAGLLYPDAHITVEGFEDAGFPDNFFDVAIGNVPFGDYKVADKRYDKNNFLIHDYFFGATRS